MRSRSWLFVFVFISALASAQRQPFRAPIGNSVVALRGPWAFHPGDDMAWASPDLDDSGWAPMDLSPTEGKARSKTGELFGFDRTADLVVKGMSAAGISQAAEAFGQQDDITVLTLTRTPVSEPAAASLLAYA